MGQLGFVLILFFLFSSYSRVLEFTLANLHLLMVTSLIALLAALLSGGIPRALTSPMGIGLIALTLVFVASIPFGVWPGGSTKVLIDEWSRSFMVFPLVGALLTSTNKVGKAVKAIGIGVGILAVLALLIGESRLGRLQMPYGQYGNPNDLGNVMCLGMICSLYVIRSRSSMVLRIIAVPMLFLMVLVLLKTGSRGALIGLVITVPFFLAQYSTLARIRMIIVCLFLVMVAVPFVPNSIRNRFTTIFSGQAEVESEDEAVLNQEAVGSTNGRMYLLKRSLIVTAKHPVLGVGIGNFPVAEDNLSKTEGVRGNWHVTHNAYTQISSEAGIIALLVYLGILASAWRALSNVKKKNRPGLHPSHEDIHILVGTLQLYLVFMIAAGMFSSFAYLPFVPTLVGLIFGLSYGANREFGFLASKKKATAAAAQAEPDGLVQQSRPALPSKSALALREANVWNSRLS